jgi:WD40 repeat protein
MNSVTASTATGFSITNVKGIVDFDYVSGLPDLEIPDRPQSAFAPRAIAIHPFGHQIACGDKTGQIKVYDLRTMKLVHSIQAHSAEILTLSFSPPLMSLDYGQTWNIFSPHLDTVATNGNHGGEGEEEENELASRQKVDSQDILVLLASAGRDRLIHVFNANIQYSPLDTLDHHSSSVTVVRFTSDGKRFISCGGDKTMVFNSVNGPTITKLKSIQTPLGTVNGLAVDVSNKFAVTSGQDKKLNIWNVSVGKHMRSYKCPELNSELYKTDLDPSGK